MGPRLLSRGVYWVASQAEKVFAKLQWGRGFSAAESRRGGSEPPLRCWLQWGRGFSAAESIAFCAVPLPLLVLQWGRGFSAAESF